MESLFEMCANFELFPIQNKSLCVPIFSRGGKKVVVRFLAIRNRYLYDSFNNQCIIQVRKKNRSQEFAMQFFQKLKSLRGQEKQNLIDTKAKLLFEKRPWEQAARYTVCKLQKFSVTHIFREIKVAQCTDSKSFQRLDHSGKIDFT